MNRFKLILLGAMKNSYIRRILFTISLFLGIILWTLLFISGFGINLLTAILWEIGLLFIVLPIIYFALDYLYGKKMRFLRKSYDSLDKWVEGYDIGSATNIVKSLSNEKDLEDFFRVKREIVINKHKQNYDLLWVNLDKNSFFVEIIRELLVEVDTATKKDLFFLKKYLDYEAPNKTIQEKFLNVFFSVSSLAGFLACIKYSLDILVKGLENRINAIFYLGCVLIAILVIAFFLIIAFVLIRLKKQTIEKNCKNFLDLAFKVLDEDSSNEELNKRSSDRE
ncbi:hypothetical protein D929_02338 [Enterococcus faecalis 02-MB-P-10]|uniref:hypothetical protein n=1 Tax=Enterococcus faecalis TaxID=1351 RepID=UPI0003535CD7|nr:hypothetical protein [Enterococcus faecalis]EPH70494.1 hypothetical protein D929_02338 [Enterococcus faecalis 02-MB-P-10]